MKYYSVAAFKSHLSKILTEVLKGEEVVVTDHNRPVAKVSNVRGYPPLNEHFDLKTFLSSPPVKLKPGAPSSLEVLRKIRDE